MGASRGIPGELRVQSSNLSGAESHKRMDPVGGGTWGWDLGAGPAA